MVIGVAGPGGGGVGGTGAPKRRGRPPGKTSATAPKTEKVATRTSRGRPPAAKKLGLAPGSGITKEKAAPRMGRVVSAALAPTTGQATTPATRTRYSVVQGVVKAFQGALPILTSVRSTPLRTYAATMLTGVVAAGGFLVSLSQTDPLSIAAGSVVTAFATYTVASRSLLPTPQASTPALPLIPTHSITQDSPHV